MEMVLNAMIIIIQPNNFNNLCGFRCIGCTKCIASSTIQFFNVCLSFVSFLNDIRFQYVRIIPSSFSFVSLLNDILLDGFEKMKFSKSDKKGHNFTCNP